MRRKYRILAYEGDTHDLYLPFAIQPLTYLWHLSSFHISCVEVQWNVQEAIVSQRGHRENREIYRHRLVPSAATIFNCGIYEDTEARILFTVRQLASFHTALH